MKGKSSEGRRGLNDAVDDLQRKMIVEALQQTRTLTEAAALLKIKYGMLCYQMQRLSIERSVEVTRTVRVRVK